MPKKLVLIAAVAATCFPSLVVADSFPDMTVFANAEVVPNEELAQMRGRFIQASQVAYFGLRMTTMWETGGGFVMAVELNVGVSNPTTIIQAQDVEATVSFVTFDPTSSSPSLQFDDHGILDSGESEQEAQEIVIPESAAQGLNTGSGVAQSVLIEGDDNEAINDIRFNISEGTVAEEAVGGAGPIGVPMDLTESTSVMMPDGSTATVILEPGQIGVAVAMEGLGVAQQGILSEQANRLRQDISVVSSSQNMIANQTIFTFLLDAASQAPDVGSFLSAIESIQ